MNGGHHGLEVGDLVGAGGLEDEVAAVVVGAPGDVVEAAVVEGAEQGTGNEPAVDEVLDRKAAPAVEAHLDVLRAGGEPATFTAPVGGGCGFLAG